MPVEIIAHRGSSRDCLENTMQAFQRALEQGADAFELDVHATRDGVVLVHHDPDIRLNDSDPMIAHPVVGKVPHHRRLMINAMDYTTLREVRLQNGETIPTLDDVLNLARQRVTVYVEVKGLGIENDVIECLLRHPDTQTAVHSFDHRIPQTIAQRKPGTPIGILSASYVLDWRGMIGAAKARDLWQQTSLIDRSLVDEAHQSGARVVAWTENNVAHAVELVQMGVDAICTDIPMVIRAGLAEAGHLTR